MMENGEVLMGKDNLGQSKMIIWEGMAWDYQKCFIKDMSILNSYN